MIVDTKTNGNKNQLASINLSIYVFSNQTRKYLLQQLMLQPKENVACDLFQESYIKRGQENVDHGG